LAKRSAGKKINRVGQICQKGRRQSGAKGAKLRGEARKGGGAKRRLVRCGSRDTGRRSGREEKKNRGKQIKQWVEAERGVGETVSGKKWLRRRKRGMGGRSRRCDMQR